MLRKFRFTAPTGGSGSIDFIPNSLTVWNYSNYVVWLNSGGEIAPEYAITADFIIPPVSTLSIPQPAPEFGLTFGPSAGSLPVGFAPICDLIYVATPPAPGLAIGQQAGGGEGGGGCCGGGGLQLTSTTLITQPNGYYSDGNGSITAWSGTASQTVGIGWVLPDYMQPIPQVGPSRKVIITDYSINFVWSTNTANQAFTILGNIGFIPGNIVPYQGYVMSLFNGGNAINPSYASNQMGYYQYTAIQQFSVPQNSQGGGYIADRPTIAFLPQVQGSSTNRYLAAFLMVQAPGSTGNWSININPVSMSAHFAYG